MAFTDQQIKDYALKMEAKGAPPDKIRTFISQAKSEQTGGSFKPVSTSKRPKVDWNSIDISKMPEGADPGHWKSLDEAGKQSFAANWARISPERRAKILPGLQASGRKQGFGYHAGEFTKDFGSNLLTSGFGAVKAVGQAGLNTLGAASDVGGKIGEFSTGGLVRPPKEGSGQGFRDLSQGFGQLTDDYTDSMSQFIRGQKADPMARAGGELSGTVLSMAPAISGGQKARAGINAAGKALPRLRALLGLGAESAIGTTGLTAATKGKLPTKEELMAGGVIDFGLNLLGGGLGKLSKRAYNKLLGLTRTQKGTLAKKGVDLGEALSKKGYVGINRQNIANKAGKDIGKLSNKLEDLIRRAELGDTNAIVKFGEQAGFKADDLLKNVEKYVLNSAKLKPKFGEMGAVKNQIKQAINEFKKTVGNRGLSLTEVQNLKKKLGKSLSKFYSKTGDAKATARELVNDLLRKNAKEIIERNVAGASQLNKEMAPLIQAKEALEKKGDYSGYLTDVILGGTVGAGSLAQGQDPTEALKNVLLAGFLKKGLTSPFGRSLSGSVAGKTGRAFQSQVTSPALKLGGLEGLTNMLFGQKN